MADESKIKRDAFLYLQPSESSYGKPEEYAQCVSCGLWTGEERKRCYILGKKKEVLGTDTCCFYCNSEPQVDTLAGKEIEAVTPEEAGFYRGKVRCQNCSYFNPTISSCKLFFMLDTEFPDDFSLGSSVDKHGCCNLNIPLKFKGDKKDAISRYVSKVLNKKVTLDNLF